MKLIGRIFETVINIEIGIERIKLGRRAKTKKNMIVMRQVNK